MTSQNLYVYGVVNGDALDRDLEVEAVHGADRVTTVDYRTLSAVVSDIDTLDPERTDAAARAHDEVLREVMTRGDGRTVVPMQFGMVFKDERALKNVLRSGRRAFTKAFRDVGDAVEFGVKVVAPEGANGDAEAIREDIAATLSTVAAGESVDDRFSDRLIFNRSYLVEREDRETFDAAVDRIEEEHDGHTVRYSGPWAPYNFVDIEIGVER